jgi:hypothetical protein
MRRYGGQNEVRFKVTDKQKEISKQPVIFTKSIRWINPISAALVGGAWIMFVCHKW